MGCCCGDDEGHEGFKDKATKENVERVRDHGVLYKRDCTDWLFIIIFGIFVILWIVLLAVAANNGKPERILYPENFRGELCNDVRYDGKSSLEDFPNAWIPRASRLSYAICVPKCPAVGDIVCNNDDEEALSDNNTVVPNTYYSHTAKEFQEGQRALYACTISNCDNVTQAAADRWIGVNIKMKQYKCFVNWYESGATLFRCLPFQANNDNVTLAELVGDSSQKLAELADYVGVGQFFNRGFGEVKQSWLVILLSALTCCVVSLIWIFLLRWIMKPLVYLCIILILALLILVGYLAMLMADDLEQVKLPGDTATDNQVKIWRAIQYAAWILAAMYVVLMAWMIKRIKIAIAIMREASYTFLESPGLIIIPPIVFATFIGWVAFFIIAAVYIQTMGKVTYEDFEEAARDVYGDTLVNFTQQAINRTGSYLSDNNITSNSTINTTKWEDPENLKWFHAYNFFMFLWVSTICIMFGFFTIAMTAVTFYFSADQGEMMNYANGKTVDEGGIEIGKEKHTPYFTIPRSAWNAFRYHLGTIIIGSFLIALIQFVRALFIYFKETFLEEWKETQTVACLLRIIDYCLWYIGKIVEAISKNAFIVCCCLNINFRKSAVVAMELLVSNAARVSILATLATVACVVLKFFIVGTNMMFAWLFINTEALTENKRVESGLFPMFGIIIMSFIIASIFVNVYESLVDTTLMTFLVDEEYFGSNYTPEELAELTGMFQGAEIARREYERKLREASRGPGKTPKTAEPSDK